ncbi:MAG: hypothetical protein CMO55_25140 [Verrucomicrobiales bacterium]|nr:hypothetical protein [Verrucomicrobiales bacterium]
MLIVSLGLVIFFPACTDNDDETVKEQNSDTSPDASANSQPEAKVTQSKKKDPFANAPEKALPQKAKEIKISSKVKSSFDLPPGILFLQGSHKRLDTAVVCDSNEEEILAVCFPERTAGLRLYQPGENQRWDSTFIDTTRAKNSDDADIISLRNPGGHGFESIKVAEPPPGKMEVRVVWPNAQPAGSHQSGMTWEVTLEKSRSLTEKLEVFYQRALLTDEGARRDAISKGIPSQSGPIRPLSMSKGNSSSARFSELSRRLSLLNEADGQEFTRLYEDYLEVSNKIGEYNRSDHLDITVEEVAAIATVAEDGSVTLSNFSTPTKSFSRSGVILTAEGNPIGIVQFPPGGTEYSVRTIAEASKIARLGFDANSLQLAVKIQNKDQFDDQNVYLDAITTTRLGLDITSLTLRVGPASDTKLVDDPSGVKRLELASSQGRLVEKGFLYKMANYDKRVADVNLNLRGKQGTIRFRAQAVAKKKDNVEVLYPPFEFILGRYRDEPDTLRVPEGFSVSIYDPNSNQEDWKKTLEAQGRIRQVFEVKNGDLVGILTDKPSLEFIDSSKKEWSEGLAVEVRPNCFACGTTERVFTISPEDNIIERWALGAGKEAAELVDVSGDIFGIASSPHTAGAPVLVVSSEEILAIDPSSLKSMRLKMRNTRDKPIYDQNWQSLVKGIINESKIPMLKASGNGSAFSLSFPRDEARGSTDSILVLTPDLVSSTVMIEEASGFSIGYSGSITYNYDRIRNLSERHTVTSRNLVLPDSVNSGMALTFERKEFYYLPVQPDESRVVPIPTSPRINSFDDAEVVSSFPVSTIESLKKTPDFLSPFERTVFNSSQNLFLVASATSNTIDVYNVPLAPEARERIRPLESILLPPRVNRNEEFSFQFPSPEEGSTFRLLMSPDGAKISTDGLLSWDPSAFPDETAKFEIEIVSPKGDSVVKDISLKMGGQVPVMVRAEKDEDSDAVAIPHRTLTLSRTPDQVFLARKGELLCTINHEGRRLDVFELATGELYLSAEVDSESTVGVANAEFIYLYSEVGKAIESISLENPKIRKRIPANHKIVSMGISPHTTDVPLVVVEYFDPKVLGSQTSLIGNQVITVARLGGSNCLVDLLDPETLETKIKNYSDEFLSSVKSCTLSPWKEYRNLPASPSGDTLLLPTGMIAFNENGISMTPFNNPPIPTLREREPASISNDQEYLFLSNGSIRITDGDKVNTTGNIYLPFHKEEYALSVRNGYDGHTIHRLHSTEPVLYVGEFLEHKSRSNSPSSKLRYFEKTFFIPGTDTLITISNDMRTVFIRELDLDVIAEQLGVAL